MIPAQAGISVLLAYFMNEKPVLARSTRMRALLFAYGVHTTQQDGGFTLAPLAPPTDRNLIC